MAATTPSELATSVLTTLQDVLVHQRARWASLLAHQRQYEGWWKAEFALALESWTWVVAPDRPEDYWVRGEQKPRHHGIEHAQGKKLAGAVDLLVARWSEELNDMVQEPPRVWIEIKERGTWWGGATKALGAWNKGLISDVMKWEGAKWRSGDVVVACHITAHDSQESPSCALPPDWVELFNHFAHDFPRFLPTRSVCYPSTSPEIGKIDRYVTIDFFTIHGSEHIPRQALPRRKGPR